MGAIMTSASRCPTRSWWSVSPTTCARATAVTALRGGDRGRHAPAAADPDDRAGDDHRHGADGAGPGRGGEQNAPLGRAVIGGLLMATFATLFIVPIFYTLLRRKPPTPAHARCAVRGRGRRARTGDGRYARMAKTRSLRSLLLYLCRLAAGRRRGLGGLVDVATARTRSLHARARRWPSGVARGPVVQVMTVTQGPKERLITLAGRHPALPDRHALRQGRRLSDEDHGRPRRRGEGRRCAGGDRLGRDRQPVRQRASPTWRTRSALPSGRATLWHTATRRSRRRPGADRPSRWRTSRVAELATMKSYERSGAVRRHDHRALRRSRRAGAERRRRT